MPIAAQGYFGICSLYSKEEKLSALYGGRTEAYQILPKTYLEKCGFKTREIYGQAANITYLSKEIKKLVKKKAPADYKEQLLGNLSEERRNRKNLLRTTRCAGRNLSGGRRKCTGDSGMQKESHGAEN